MSAAPAVDIPPINIAPIKSIDILLSIILNLLSSLTVSVMALSKHFASHPLLLGFENQQY